ncbi:uncharacterized protein LOC144160607 [Haemaphysalis longicornis]
MPQGGNTAPAPTPGWHPPREPRMFTGNADEDVEEWLTHYRRVSRYNRWDTAAQLANVVFSLDETALTWFENNESKLTTWDRFVEEISARFGDSVGKKKQAEQTLLHRAQVPGETCTTYIEEVLKLCRLVDPQMSEDDKVGHLLKGIAKDVYNFLIGREKLESASDVVQHCRTFEALKKRRITPKFGRLANVTTVASVDVTPPPDYAETIRRIVREELLRHQEPRRYTDGLHVHESYVLQDVQANSLSPSSAQFRDPSYTPRNESPQRLDNWDSSRYSHDVQQFSRRPQRPTYDQRPQRPAYDRRFDGVYERSFPPRERDLPVCYNCGFEGHISRYCRRRRQAPRYQQTPVWNRPNARNARYDTRLPTALFSEAPPRRDSPASDRSLTPPASRQRRSPSPRRRSPPPEN